MLTRAWLFGGLVILGLPAAVSVLDGGIAARSTPLIFSQKSSNAVPVDVELVLAVDISYSMDPEEQALQREGYAAALTSREFMMALREGAHARIAVTYFEWAGAHEQRVIIPWRLIDGPESADAIAAEISKTQLRRAQRTSISGALLFGQGLLDTNTGFRGERRVIDVSGDGVNNHGALVNLARDELLAKGTVINGLPIMFKRPNYSTMDIGELDVYFEDCVVGGPGSFVIPIKERSQFKEAIRTKLVLEIAGRAPERQVIPAAANAPRVSCTIGERIWRERWGGGVDDR